MSTTLDLPHEATAAPPAALSADAFRQQLLARVFAWCYRWENVNVDYLAFLPPRGRTLRQRIGNRLRRWAQRLGLARQGFAPAEGAQRLMDVFAAADDYAALSTAMLDQPSRDLLLDLLAYRVLGERHVTFPLNNPDYWELFLSVNRERLRQPQTAVVAGLTLGLYEAPGRHGPMLVEAHPWGILNNFLVEQYAYCKATPAVRVRPGDFVIDGGGCWGDTALYFADQVGPAGRVYCWEFWDENLVVLRRNLDRNPRLAASVELVAHALWARSDETLSLRGNGAATTVAADAPGDGRAGIATLTIDDLVARRALPRVDFIKLDIEGAELPALRGAVQTLRRFRPTLAIAAYHRPDDLIVLPRLLDGLDLGYRYYLDHFTVQGGETVLFAIAGG